MKKRHIFTAFLAAGLVTSAAVDPSKALRDAREAVSQYRLDDAREHYATYEKQMRRARKSIPDEVEAERSRLVEMENMLTRVERITVIDSLAVDSAAFFKAYRLSPEAGRLVEGKVVNAPAIDMVFVPQNNTEMLYAAADTSGYRVLMGADILDDGSIDHPAPLEGADLNGGGNAAFPFMMADGMTLYYANDGEESLGGYDIFLTRRSDDGYLQPQNVGMPYNSPDNDFLLAIDEETGLGWWATDRNHIPGKLTVYVFVPNDTRVNIDPDDPMLADFARLSDYKLTQQPGKDYSDYKEKLAGISRRTEQASSADEPPFPLAIGSSRVIYHKLSDFRDSNARRAMSQAINARAEISSIQSRLSDLRAAYRRGDHSKATAILNLEGQLEDARYRMADAINQAIELELQ